MDGISVKQESSRGYKILLGIVLILAVLNVGFIGVLFYVWKVVGETASESAGIMSDLADKTFSVNTALDQSVPLTFGTKVRIKETFSVPIKTSVPISTIVNVPIVIPILGQSVNVRVPINTTIPIDLTIRIPIDEEIPINISSLFSLKMPVKISFEDTPLNDALERFRDLLLSLAKRTGN